MNSLELIARYAFPPNNRNYCGPENFGAKLLSFVLNVERDEKEVKNAFSKFECMFPHLEMIAAANGKSPFDFEIASAYWQGNELLENVKLEEWKKTGAVLAKNAKWDETLSKKYVSRINSDFVPHHSFHVLNSYTLTVKEPEVVLERVNNCLISWGKVILSEGHELNVVKRPVILNAGRFELGELQLEKVKNPKIVDCEKGDMVSMHWGFACKKLGPEELKNLEKFTLQNLRNFNPGFF